jgi:hypothetical protein
MADRFLSAAAVLAGREFNLSNKKNYNIYGLNCQEPFSPGQPLVNLDPDSGVPRQKSRQQPQTGNQHDFSQALAGPHLLNHCWLPAGLAGV